MVATLEISVEQSKGQDAIDVYYFPFLYSVWYFNRNQKVYYSIFGPKRMFVLISKYFIHLTKAHPIRSKIS